MARNNRSRRQRRRRGQPIDANASDSGQQSSSATSQKSARRPSSRARRKNQSNSYTPMMLIGGGAILVIVVAVVIFQLLSGAGSRSDFEVSLYQGQEFFGAEEINFSEVLDDGKPIVLNFWAGNCPPCRAEMPALQRVWEANEEDIIFVGLDVGVFTNLGTRQSALDLLQELNVTYPAGSTPDRTPMVNFSVRSMPTTVFFDASGEISQIWPGAISERQMNDIVNNLLEQAS